MIRLRLVEGLNAFDQMVFCAFHSFLGPDTRITLFPLHYAILEKKEGSGVFYPTFSCSLPPPRQRKKGEEGGGVGLLLG